MRIVAIRSFALLLPLLGAAAAWLWLQPRKRTAGAIYLATLWTLPTLLVLHVLAQSLGWWTFHVDGGTFFDMPVDLYLGWALLWGALPTLLLRRFPLALVVGLLMAFDLVLMPLCAPVIELGPRWLLGELVAAAIVLIPAQLLARWTDRDEHLYGRVLLQCLLFTALVLIALPFILLALRTGEWKLAASPIVCQLLLQCAVVTLVVGLSAVQEFAERGGGTPFPYDPPKRLVRSGIYAYIRNPMQVATSLLFALLAIAMMSRWMLYATVVSIAYAIGFAAWDERGDLRERFGSRSVEYAATVDHWFPSWRPHIDAPSTIYFSADCGLCSDIAQRLQRRQPAQLTFVAAELHPTRDLDRVRYESADGYAADGIVAIARALEHIHLGWAIVGFAMRLPIARTLLQLIVDASGGGRRTVLRTNVTDPLPGPPAPLPDPFSERGT
jgi:protein-S-isoprenylcysteine O-methyltransferase Ste14/predicted DCC family thiol-disulfide oxidoreductase YuxK